MKPHFKFVPCAAAVALMSAGCAMLPFGGGKPAASADAAVGAPSSPPVASAPRAVNAVEVETLFQLGRQQLVAGRPRAAIEHFASVLDREPRHVEALNALGVAVAELDRLPEAISVLRRAVALAPQAVHVRNNLGYALYRAREFAQARVELHAALKQQPDNALALRNLALVDAALPAARVIAQPAPTDPEGTARITAVPPQRSPVVAAAEPALPAKAVAARADAAVPPPGKPTVAQAPLQSRSWPGILGFDQQPSVAQADEGAVRQPDPMVLRMLGLDNGNVAQAKAVGGGLQRAKAGGPDPAFEQRPVRSYKPAPQFIRVRPVEPVERVPAIRG